MEEFVQLLDSSIETIVVGAFAIAAYYFFFNKKNALKNWIASSSPEIASKINSGEKIVERKYRDGSNREIKLKALDVIFTAFSVRTFTFLTIAYCLGLLIDAVSYVVMEPIHESVIANVSDNYCIAQNSKDSLSKKTCPQQQVEATIQKGFQLGSYFTMLNRCTQSERHQKYILHLDEQLSSAIRDEKHQMILKPLLKTLNLVEGIIVISLAVGLCSFGVIFCRGSELINHFRKNSKNIESFKNFYKVYILHHSRILLKNTTFVAIMYAIALPAYWSLEERYHLIILSAHNYLEKKKSSDDENVKFNFTLPVKVQQTEVSE